MSRFHLTRIIQLIDPAVAQTGVLADWIGLSPLPGHASSYRRWAAAPLEPGRAAVADQIERQIAQRDVDKFGEMPRKEPGKYWSSPELRWRQHRDAIAAATREEAPPQPVTQPAAVPNPPAAAPAAPAPAKESRRSLR
jgi:hypothetical protein